MIQARNHSCDILVKNGTAFCSCPKNLFEAKLKCNGLISLGEEISMQHIDSAALLLVITLRQVYNEREQLGQKDSLKFNVGAKTFAERDEKGLICIGIKEGLPSL